MPPCARFRDGSAAKQSETVFQGSKGAEHLFSPGQMPGKDPSLALRMTDDWHSGGQTFGAQKDRVWRSDGRALGVQVDRVWRSGGRALGAQVDRVWRSGEQTLGAQVDRVWRSDGRAFALRWTKKRGCCDCGSSPGGHADQAGDVLAHRPPQRAAQGGAQAHGQNAGKESSHVCLKHVGRSAGMRAE